MEAFLFLVADWLSAIQCQDTPYQDIAAIVEFMYRGEINVSQVPIILTCFYCTL
jgi:hypothetical protein